MTRFPLLLTVALVALSAPPAALCSIRYSDGSHWRPSVEHARLVATEADAVVRARATRVDSIEVGGQRHPHVVLKVVEVLAAPIGDTVPTSLAVYGWLSDADDFNPAPVPYPAVRPEGQRGACFAEAYRRGGEFLLLLKRRGSQLSPYWAALAPTNEQIRGRDDPWVTWVLEERRRARR